MTSPSPLTDLDIITPERFRDHGYPWDAWDRLRREAPVFRYPHFRKTGRVDRDYGDVWVITKHADIQTISRDPKLWIQGPDQSEDPGEDTPRHLLAMDPPEHAQYRGASNRHFTPRALSALEPRIEAMTAAVIDGVVDRLFDRADHAGVCDFVTDFSARLPVHAICELLGVPERDADTMFRWTNETLGAGDPEYQRGRSRQETGRVASENIMAYFADLAEQRRARPQEDLMTVLVQAEIDGAPMPQWELLQYALLLLIAGNETTRNATSGGLLALMENPDQFDRLRQDPSLVESAVEEILRWVSPVVVFLRTATADTEVRGVPIRAGEHAALFYPSANRDEDVFDAPYRFDITREPNDHLAFGGFGEHFCLGANLARLEMRTMFKTLLRRVPEIEQAGEPERLNSSFLGGIKHLPVRLRITD